MSDTTVTVKHIDHQTILMVWADVVTPLDVKEAFKEVDAILNKAEQEMFVVVDISTNPNFPLSATISGALFGPYRNPKLREWLIVGSNAMAHSIERTLANIARRSNVRWFTTQAEAYAYVEQSKAAELNAS